MASRWWSASMLLASLMSLYWMTSSAQPHVPLKANLSRSSRVSRDLPASTREKVQASTEVFKDILTLANEVIQFKNKETASNIIKGLAKCTSLAPGIGGLVGSIINMALSLVSQDDPVLTAVKEGFGEVNRKLDSLSFQISDLATDVEWNNYISIYSLDERNILNAWKKFNEFSKVSQDKERFITHYENTGAENSMNNLYHSLTVTQTSLTVNINQLLTRKLKCHVGQIGKYNLYLNSLLWKAMVVNQFYTKLHGLTNVDKNVEHTNMFKEVTEAQISTIENCLNKYKDYMKDDVIEKATAFKPSDKQAIASEVKKSLDQKYNWYSWVVLVYDSKNEKDILLYNMTRIPVGDIIVAVDYTLKAEDSKGWRQQVKEGADKCYKDKECTQLEKLPTCEFSVKYSRYGGMVNLPFADYAKIVYVAHADKYKVEPKPFHSVGCPWITWTTYQSNIFINYSKKLPVCTHIKCEKRKCERLLDSNEPLCKCDDGYYDDTCEKKVMF